MSRVHAALIGALFCVSCSSETASTGESFQRARSSIVGGRPSGDDEDFVAYVVSGRAGDTLRCSATLLAPNVAMTARHCLLIERSAALNCTADGALEDPTDPRAQNVDLEQPANIQVSVGVHRSASAAAVAVFVPVEIGLCRNDIALVVLERNLLDVHVPVRLSAVRLGEKLSVAGWGFTADGQTALPELRTGLDDVRVDEVGPGRIPAGTFAIRGGTMCFGDSGAGARIAGAVAGVYSRIEGGSCTLEQGRNVFMMTAPHRSLIDAAFARAGSKAWYEGEPPPWLLPTGAPCAADSACQLGRCDAQRGTCATPCGDGGSVCRETESCDTARGLCAATDAAPPVAPAPPPAPAPASCEIAARRGGDGIAALMFMTLASLVVRRRARATTKPSRRRSTFDWSGRHRR